LWREGVDRFGGSKKRSFAMGYVQKIINKRKNRSKDNEQLGTNEDIADKALLVKPNNFSLDTDDTDFC
jgi:hypothetical protein